MVGEHKALPIFLQVGSAGVLVKNNMVLEKGRQILPKWKDFVAEHDKAARQGRPPLQYHSQCCLPGQGQIPKGPVQRSGFHETINLMFLGHVSVLGACRSPWLWTCR